MFGFVKTLAALAIAAAVVTITAPAATAQPPPDYAPNPAAMRMTVKQWAVFGRDTRRFRAVTQTMINRILRSCTAPRKVTTFARLRSCMAQALGAFNRPIGGMAQRALAIADTREGRCAVALNDLAGDFEALDTTAGASRILWLEYHYDAAIKELTTLRNETIRALGRQRIVARECRP